MSAASRRKRRNLGAEAATVRVGKKGITAPFIEEVSKNLKKRGKVRVKILKTGLGDHTAKEIAENLAEATGSTVVQLRGHTFTLRKSKKILKRYL